MIDRTEFAKVMGVFADRIGRPLAPATAEVYFETLGEALTTEEFVAGARIVFRAHTFNTWPAPQQFIDAVRPGQDPALAGAEMFEDVVKAVGSMYDDHNARVQRLAALGPIAERAYRAAGGYRDFVNVLEKDRPFLRNRFVEAFVAATEEQTRHGQALAALDRGALDPVVENLVTGTVKKLARPLRILPDSSRDRALPRGDR